jgi:hypothetical protein
MPGHGPLTQHHDTCFEAPDEVLVNTRFRQG